jgi:hypothetical protein
MRAKEALRTFQNFIIPMRLSDESKNNWTNWQQSSDGRKYTPIIVEFEDLVFDPYEVEKILLKN